MIINPFQSFPGVILSAFYYGYMVTQLPGGVLARKFGGATILGLSVGTSGALTMLTPLAARVHVGVLITLRVAIGMAEVKLKFNPFLSLYICILFYLFNFQVDPIGTKRVLHLLHSWSYTFVFRIFPGICVSGWTCAMEPVGSSIREEHISHIQPRWYHDCDISALWYGIIIII